MSENKIKLEIEIDFGDFSDDDWICESHKGQVNLIKCDGKPSYTGGTDGTWFKMFSVSQTVDLPLFFFRKNGIKPQKSLITIREFKQKFCNLPINSLRDAIKNIVFDINEDMVKNWISDGYKFICGDVDGSVYLFQKKPDYNQDMWGGDIVKRYYKSVPDLCWFFVQKELCSQDSLMSIEDFWKKYFLMDGN